MKSMIKKLLVVLVLVFGLSTACNDILDIPPVRDIPETNVFEGTRDIESALVGAYNQLQTLYCGSWLRNATLLADEARINPARRAQAGADLNIYLYDIGNTGQSQFSTAYTAINTANSVISIIQDFSGSSDRDSDFDRYADRLLAEALFIRATCHFETVRLYANQYSDRPEAVNLPAIPWRNVPTRSRANYHSSSVKRIYDLILQDLGWILDSTQAYPGTNIVPELPMEFDGQQQYAAYASSNFGRPLKAAAHALRASVYFQMGESAETYRKAIDDCDDALGFAPGSFDQSVLFRLVDGMPQNAFRNQGLQDQTQEVIWWVVNVLGDESSRNMHAAFDPNWVGQPNIIVDNNFFYDLGIATKTYSKDTVIPDMRSPVYAPDGIFKGVKSPVYDVVGSNPTNDILGTSYTTKWQPTNGNEFQIQNIPVYRTAEFILMRAECYAIVGYNNSPAYSKTNLFVDAAWKDLRSIWFARYNLDVQSPPLVNPFNSYKELIDAIRKDRAVELAFEGKRLHDLRRRWNDPVVLSGLGYGEPVIRAGARASEGFTDKNWNSDDLVFPIPDNEVLSNKDVLKCCDCGDLPCNDQ